LRFALGACRDAESVKLKPKIPKNIPMGNNIALLFATKKSYDDNFCQKSGSDKINLHHE